MCKLSTNTAKETTLNGVLSEKKVRCISKTLLNSIETCFHATLSLIVLSFQGKYPCKLSGKLIEFLRSNTILEDAF